MLKSILLGGTLALAVAISGGCARGIPGHPDKLQWRDIEFREPQPRIEQLSNGITVYLLEDRELPLVSFSFLLPNGDLNEPAAKKGVGDILNTAWRGGGTTTTPGPELDEELEFLAASVETSIGNQTSTVSASGFSRDTDRLLEIARDLMLSPALPDDKIAFAKRQALERIRRQNDSPEGVASRTFRRAMYGTDSVFAQVPTRASIESITREDLVDLHGRIVGPRNVRIAASGDFDTDEMLARLERSFGTMPEGRQEVFQRPAAPTTIDPGLHLVARDVSQSQVRFGHLGLPRHHPDYFAVEVYNEIFGTGGFTSRLMSDVRSTRGLAYSVGGGLSMDDYNGTFAVSLSTKNETVREAHDAVLFQMERMRTEPVGEAELKRAKAALVNSYVFRFTSPSSIVVTRMANDHNGYPADWIERYVPGIEAVTADDVMRVAREHTHPDKLVILAVGPEAPLRAQFEGLPEPEILVP